MVDEARLAVSRNMRLSVCLEKVFTIWYSLFFLVSKIESFGVFNRDVYLEGEAFFDVKHNAKLPFIVRTPAMDVKALGTAFDVKAYLNEKTTETSLIRGLLEVTLKEGSTRTMLLYPNQKIKYIQYVQENFPKQKRYNQKKSSAIENH